MIESGDWGRYHGHHVPDLCQRLAEYHQVEQVLACSSGTAAVELALRGVGVGEGDEVILAAYDFKANFQNVLYLKAIPVLVDLDPRTWQLDPQRVAAAVTPKTRAILAAHLHGAVVNMPELRQIADQHQIPIVEDACQNPGAMLYGHRAGTGADVGVISFGGTKLLTAGRGGAVVTSRAEIAERIKRQVMRGNDAYPLSEIQAAILRPQVDQLDSRNARRREEVVRLCSRLPAGLTPLQLPTDEIQPAYYKVGFRYDSDDFGGLSRDLFVEALVAEGIAMGPGFRSNHLIHASRRFRAADELVQASLADEAMLGLFHPALLDSTAVDEVITAIHKVREWAPAILANAVARA